MKKLKKKMNKNHQRQQALNQLNLAKYHPVSQPLKLEKPQELKVQEMKVYPLPPLKVGLWERIKGRIKKLIKI